MAQRLWEKLKAVFLHEQDSDTRHLLHCPGQAAQMIAVQSQLSQLHHISERKW